MKNTVAAGSTFDQEAANAILDMVSDGISLRAACEKLDIPRRTVRSWLARTPEFAAAYDVARKVAIDDHVDGMLATATGVAGSDNNAAVQAAKLQIDTIKWLAAKMLPERFGDKM